MTSDSRAGPSSAGVSTAPVFIVGSPRSGTTLLYHMLLSAGGFAVYRAETHVFDTLVPRFGGLRRRRDREELLRHWIPSEYFRRSGLNPDEFRQRVLSECCHGGDFLRIFMGSIAAQQGVARWAECTPVHLLYIPEIKRTLPEARIVHIIRDGRDVALSMAKQGWVRPLPANAGGSTFAAAVFWEWLLEKGRNGLRRYPDDVLEVRYEQLVAEPDAVLGQVGAFIQHDLDYKGILESGIGSVSKPNTSFEGGKQDFNPVGRWKSCSAQEMALLEAAAGGLLRELGYGERLPSQHQSPRLALERTLYRAKFDIRGWLKHHTPLGARLTSIQLLKDYRAADSDRLMAT